MKATIIIQIEVEATPEALEQVKARSQGIAPLFHDIIRRVNGYEGISCFDTEIQTGTYEIIDLNSSVPCAGTIGDALRKLGVGPEEFNKFNQANAGVAPQE